MVDSTSPIQPIPALFTNIFNAPHSFLIWLITSSQRSAFVTSCSRKLTPSSLATSWPPSTLISEIYTFAPCSVKSCAIPFPKPEAPPVTNATLSLIRSVIAI